MNIFGQYIPDSEYNINEVRGVWTHDDDTNKSTDNLISEYIYTYVRETLQKEFNKRGGSIPPKIEFDIPDSYLKINNTKKLKQLSILFVKTNKRETAMSCILNQQYDTCTIHINVAVNHPQFKMMFMHELKHYWKYSFSKSSFIDDFFNNRDQSPKQSLNSTESMSHFLYKLNPEEFQSYKEQIYSLAYDIGYNDTDDIKTAVDKTYSYMYLTDRILTYVYKTMSNPDISLKKYIVSLFLSNCDDALAPMYSHWLFNHKLYNNPVLKPVLEQIKTNHAKFTRQEIYRDIYDRLTPEVLKNDEFVKTLFSSTIKRIKRYVDEYKTRLQNIVAFGYESGVKQRKKDAKIPNTSYQSNLGLYNYTLFYPDNRVGLEVFFRDNMMQETMCVVKGDNPGQCVCRFYLAAYKLLLKCSFVFDTTGFSIMTKKYSFPINWDELVKIADIPDNLSVYDTVDYINNIDLEKVLEHAKYKLEETFEFYIDHLFD